VFARFYFLIAYTTSISFYLLLDHVIRSSAINLHLAFDLGFGHHRCQVSVQRCVAAGASNDPGRNSNEPRAAVNRPASAPLTVWLPLPTLMQAHLPRHTSAAAACSGGGRRSVSQLLVTLQIIIWSIGCAVALWITQSTWA